MFTIYPDTPFKVEFSFGRIIENLRTEFTSGRLKNDEATRQDLEQIDKVPALVNGITEFSQISDHQDLLARLLKDYFPPGLTDNEIKAVTFPYSGIIFNHTNRFKKIVASAGPEYNFNIRDFDDHQSYVLSCCLIIKYLFGLDLDFSKPLFYDIPLANGIIKHYRILYNGDFLELFANDQALEITKTDLQLLIDNYEDLSLWKKFFPPGSYVLRGFAIVSLYDATVENAVSILKEQLLSLNAPAFKSSAEAIFRSIYRNPDIRFGFTVYDAEDQMFTTGGLGYQVTSYLVNGKPQRSVPETLCLQAQQHLVSERRYFTISDVSRFREKNPDSPVAITLDAQQLGSVILAPVVKNGQLLGVLEVVAPLAGQLNSINANKLEIIMPFFTTTIERLSAQFQNKIQAIIQDNYTSIHSSVYWKFREAAKGSLLDGAESRSALPEINFVRVLPLYGQIDIKGSSQLRNESTRKDLTAQLESLNRLIGRCKPGRIAGDAGMIQMTLEKYISELSFSIHAGTEQLISHYLQTEVHSLIDNVDDPDMTPMILDYFKQADQEKGEFHKYRRMYDTTITAVNNTLSSVIDEEQQEAQMIYPHYFERSKTDGVDHMIYIGSSIHPAKPLTPAKLSKIRLWQLLVMCKMERAHRNSITTLPYALEITSLVLIHSVPLNIRFRMDEKRFDVDGSYNARFEIIKKRIDKAYIKGSIQRIISPGKLTLVYADAIEASEYKGYLGQLAELGYVENNIEDIEIEDLQGVTGLRAMRIAYRR